MARVPRPALLPALVAAAAASTSPATAAPASRVAQDRVPHQVIVRYAPGTTAEQRAAARDAVGARLGRRLALPRAELLVLPRTTPVPEAVDLLDRRRGVAYAEANALTEVASACPGTLADGARCLPDDPQFKQQYDLDNTRQVVAGSSGGVFDADVDAVEAWNISRGSQDVVVAVVDSGIAYDNPDLAPNLWTNAGEQGLAGDGRDKRSNGVDDDRNGYVDDWRGWDVVGRRVADPGDSDNDPYDVSGHGTHVAGTLGARSNNGKGVAGLNWDVRIMNVRVRAERSNESHADIADAFVYAARNGARVVNVSLSGRDYTQYLADTIEAHPDVLFVVAAGNDGLELDSAPNSRWPCEYPSPNLVCVGATGRSDEMASWSNRGARSVDLAAPGMVLIGSQPAYVRQAAEPFDTNPFAAPARWTTGPAGVAGDWGLSSTNVRTGKSLTNRATATKPNPPNSYVEAVKAFDLSGRRGCELRATVWLKTPDAASGMYWQARGDRDFMAPSRTPAQDTPNPSNDTIAFFKENRTKSTPRVNISDHDGDPTVYVRMGVLQSSSATQVQAWVDDLQLWCTGTTYSADGVADTDLMAGTSMATPHVAGVAALMLAQDPSRTVPQLRAGLLRAVDPLPSLAGRTVTGGRLNAYKALAASTVRVTDGVLRVTAGDGTTNHFAISRVDGSFRVRDPWTPYGTGPMAGSRLVPGAGCSAAGETEVSCPVGGIDSIAVDTGDLTDTVDAADVGVPVSVDEPPPPPPASYAQTVLADEPVAYWRLGETSGTTAADQTGGSPGRYSGAYALGAAGAVAGDPALALSRGQVAVADTPELRTGDAFTFEAWVKLERLGTMQGIAFKGGTYNLLLNSGNRLQLRKPGSGTIVTATEAVPDTTGFHQLAVTKSGATVRLYLDGRDVTGLVANRPLEPAATQLLLGTGVDPLVGVLDEVSLYDEALPASAIAAHHRAATSG